MATGTSTPVLTLNVPTASATNRGALSAADWTAFNGKAPLASPTFTGTPVAPTAIGGTNTTQLATTTVSDWKSLLVSERVPFYRNYLFWLGLLLTICTTLWYTMR